MEHWAYRTDDDEPPEKETSCDAFTFQQPAAMERRNADVPRQDTRDERGETSAQDDQSWARIEPHPENARPIRLPGLTLIECLLKILKVFRV